jgi:hypothetical protein
MLSHFKIVTNMTTAHQFDKIFKVAHKQNPESKAFGVSTLNELI